MSSASFVRAQLPVQLLGPLFYGIYVVTFGFCMKALLRHPQGWEKWAEISKTMFIVACLTAFFAAFDGPGSPAAAYNGTTSWMNIMGTVLGESMLIYRCWVAYGRSWRIIAVPVLTAISGLACLALSIYYQVVLPEAPNL
ncbi:hypothetical protein FPV67DRAFT_1458974 [Lyophyllum atratum]|nr:hypothetical protein FPV67DRAFT_1458974 [Lyophyllum atratum]